MLSEELAVRDDRRFRRSLLFSKLPHHKTLEDVEDVGAGGGPVGPEAGADLLFEYGPEALLGGVVEAAPGPAHALPVSQLADPVTELSGGVLGEFNWSMQHRLVEASVVAPRRLQRASSIRGSFAAGC
ncbi:ATP-binding protein [Streptomyces sp. NBC_00289]